MKPRTRFAPSPTGFLHIGGLRTALYAYTLAKHEQGEFILRIEDTDQKREVPGAIENLQTVLKKFGLNWDEFYIQSERAKSGKYREAALKLVEEGHAFYCNCPGKNAKQEGFSKELHDPCRDKKITSGAIKLKVPDNEILTYYDFVHQKDITWNSDTVYDETLLKSDGLPTYHLAVAVDDLDMHITHILRGHDWLPSTPIHLLVFKYLGGQLPHLGHLTDILSGETGKKLSKRRDSVFVETFLEQGYLPEALLNFVMLLGWAPKDNRELYSLNEFVNNFDPKGFQQANPRFYMNKLNWFNGQYIRSKEDTELAQLVKPFVKSEFVLNNLNKILPLVKDRLEKISDIDKTLLFLTSDPVYQAELWSSPQDSIAHLNYMLANFDNLSHPDFVTNIKSMNWKVGDFFMSLRIAICGSKTTPPINEVINILGKEISLVRIQKAIQFLQSLV
jgi:glutamyl-tRNA synthetase